MRTLFQRTIRTVSIDEAALVKRGAAHHFLKPLIQTKPKHLCSCVLSKQLTEVERVSRVPHSKIMAKLRNEWQFVAYPLYSLEGGFFPASLDPFISFYDYLAVDP